ncbi:MAG: carbon-nitrogen hydrolase family protein [Peptostreptococcales bacterium]
MKFKIGLCQMAVGENKALNLAKAENMILEASKKNCDILVLPEMFNCPYKNEAFPLYAEEFGMETTQKLSQWARKHKIYLFGGTIPELSIHEEEKKQIYNTCFIFDRKGELLGRYRKMHLFDIEIKDKVTFKESDTLSKGNEIVTIDTEFGKIGVAICYDLRFPELMRALALKGCQVIIVPAAFNTTTGPKHWNLTLRARAVDNQVYMVGASPARDCSSFYQAYGYSSIIDPWGDVISQGDEKEGIITSEIDLDYVEEVRNQLPLLKHRRTDRYDLIIK